MTSPSRRDIAATQKRAQARIRLLVAVRRAERPDRWDDRTLGDDPAKAIHPGRRSNNHLLAVAQSNGIGLRRVTQVPELDGGQKGASKRAGAGRAPRTSPKSPSRP